MVDLSALRVGFGFDIHKFEPDIPFTLGGVRIPHTHGLSSHTDGDAVCHAIMDALFTACGLPDIGTHFPDSDPRLEGFRSIELLRETVVELRAKHIAEILNVTVTVMTEHPRIGPNREAIVVSLASALQVKASQVGLAAGTNERFDAVGSGAALACFANVLVVVKDSGTGALARGKSIQVEEGPSSITGEGARATEEENLPERVRRFEKAVNTKLPPLPKAPPPKPGAELILYTDGASRGNPGPAASGWVVFDAQGFVVHEQGSVLGQLTNNEAEYAALLEALTWVEANLGTEFKLTLRMDSELIVKQLRGEYKIKAEHLRQTALLAMSTLAAFASLIIEHVPRAENARADALANQALDTAPKG